MGFNPLAAVVGAIVPVKKSSKLLLRQQLKKYKIDPDALPPGLLNDLFETLYEMCDGASSSKLELSDRMVRMMETYSMAIAACVYGHGIEHFDRSLIKSIYSHLGPPPGQNSDPQAPQGPLVFKDGVGFFEYQCKFGHTEILPNQLGIVALILDAKKEAHEKESILIDQKGRQSAFIKVASVDGGFGTFAPTKVAGGATLRPGDVVIWMPVKYLGKKEDLERGIILGIQDPRSAWEGYITAKIKPEIDTTNSHFKIEYTYE